MKQSLHTWIMRAADTRFGKKNPRGCYELWWSSLKRLAIMRQAKARKWKVPRVVCEPFVVSCEATETGGPSEASFDDPSSGQQHEASFGLGVLDHLEPDAMLSRCLFGRLAGVA